MEVAKIKISENCATVQDLKMITSGTVGATVSFEFDKTWDGFTKTYVFRAGNKTKDDLDATGVIPAELLKKHGVQLDVGVYGTKGDLVIPTAWARLGTIAPGADPSGDQSTNPHLPVWRQLQEDIEELKQQGGGGAGSAVLYTEQNLTPEQQAQARENIGAAKALEVEPAEDDIPKVFFGGALPQTKDDAVMSFRYISKTEDISGYCKIKAQGSSSMNYPKKNQTVKLYKDAECTEKLKVNFKGWGKQSKFCFKANWIDISHARNIVTARLWGDVVKSRSNYAEIPELLRNSPNQGAIDGFPVKVYADGVYQGRYTINIPKDAWMANMDDELNTHCILCGESNADDRSLFRAAASVDGSDWSDEVHDDVPNAIKTRWNEVINFVMNSTDEEFVSDIGNYFDVSSLIDYYLFGLVSCGLDAFGKNQLYMTYDGQKWFATMYDLDSTWGLWWDGSSFVATNYARSEYQDFKDGNGNLLYIRLANLFSVEILNRWRELRSGVLTVDNIINRFERFTDIASAELVKEDYASTTGNGDFTTIPSQTANNIQQIRKYAIERLKYCDDFMNSTETITGYTILDYIESDGNQYIDTGISGGTNAAYEIKMANSASGVEVWDTYFGGANGKNAAKIQNTGNNIVGKIPSHADNWFGLLDTVDTEIHTIRYDHTASMYVDGIEKGFGASVDDLVGIGWGEQTWYVFNSHAEPGLMASMKLYYLKMYTNGELVRDFIPVQRDSDGAYGLFDKVTSTFFENAGTGAFTGA